MDWLADGCETLLLKYFFKAAAKKLHSVGLKCHHIVIIKENNKKDDNTIECSDEVGPWSARAPCQLISASYLVAALCNGHQHSLQGPLELATGSQQGLLVFQQAQDPHGQERRVVRSHSPPWASVGLRHTGAGNGWLVYTQLAALEAVRCGNWNHTHTQNRQKANMLVIIQYQ